MIQRSLRKFSTKVQLLAVSLAVFGAVAFAAVPAHAATTTYSCGTYSSGSYSTGGGCASSTTGGNSSGSGVGAPNTGFAKLMEPANLMAVFGSLALLIIGIVVMLKSRGRKKQNVGFGPRG